MIKFRIVVSSCYYASVPRALGIEKHFTHIFVDEAGHASEPEIMISILQNVSRETNVILSGDVRFQQCVSFAFKFANSFSAQATWPDHPIAALHRAGYGQQLFRSFDKVAGLPGD